MKKQKLCTALLYAVYGLGLLAFFAASLVRLAVHRRRGLVVELPLGNPAGSPLGRALAEPGYEDRFSTSYIKFHLDYSLDAIPEYIANDRSQWPKNPTGRYNLYFSSGGKILYPSKEVIQGQYYLANVQVIYEDDSYRLILPLKRYYLSSNKIKKVRAKWQGLISDGQPPSRLHVRLRIGQNGLGTVVGVFTGTTRIEDY